MDHPLSDKKTVKKAMINMTKLQAKKKPD